MILGYKNCPKIDHYLPKDKLRRAIQTIDIIENEKQNLELKNLKC